MLVTWQLVTTFMGVVWVKKKGFRLELIWLRVVLYSNVQPCITLSLCGFMVNEFSSPIFMPKIDKVKFFQDWYILIILKDDVI